MRRERTGRSRRRVRHGFSLVEVMIALVIIVLGLWGILDLVASNEKTSRLAVRRAMAIELAGAKMAEIQAAGFDRIAALLAKAPDGAAAETLYPQQRATFQPPYVGETLTWQARLVPTGPQPGVIQVEVRVFLNDLPAALSDEEIRKNAVAVGALLVKK